MDNTGTLDRLDHSGHQYSTVSAHSTSEGRIAYQHCTCGIWRIQRFPADGQPATEAVVKNTDVTGAGRPIAERALTAS
jgi:hypothetical protein